MFAQKINIRVRKYIEHTIRNYDRYFHDKTVGRYLHDINPMVRERMINSMVKDICGDIAKVDLIYNIETDPSYFDDFRYEEVISGRDEVYIRSLRDKYLDGFKLVKIDTTIRAHRSFDPFKDGTLYFTYINKDKELEILKIEDYESLFNDLVKSKME